MKLADIQSSNLIAEPVAVVQGGIDNILCVDGGVLFTERSGTVNYLDTNASQTRVVFNDVDHEQETPSSLTLVNGQVLMASVFGDLVWLDIEQGTARGFGLTKILEPLPFLFAESAYAVSACSQRGAIAIAMNEEDVMVCSPEGEVLWHGTIDKYIYGLAWSGTGELAIAAWSGCVNKLSLDQLPGRGALLFDEFDGLTGCFPVFQAAWCGDDRVIAVGCDNTGVASGRVVAAGGGPVGVWTTSEGEIHALASSPDGSMVAVGGNDQCVTILDSQTLQPVAVVDLKVLELDAMVKEGSSPHSAFGQVVDYHEASGYGAVFGLAWSEDGSTIYAGTCGGVLVSIHV